MGDNWLSRGRGRKDSNNPLLWDHINKRCKDSCPYCRISEMESASYSLKLQRAVRRTIELEAENERLKALMEAEREWTTDKPTEEGFYWFQESGYRLMVVEVFKHDSHLYIETSTRDRQLKYIAPTTLWCGPIPTPLDKKQEEE